MADAALLNDLIWSGSDPSSIPFESLPPECVIKTNHGSGGNLFYEASMQPTEVTSELKAWLSENFYWNCREQQYYDIEPKILIEAVLDDGFDLGPLDYRFWCFDGEPKLIQVDNRSHSINPFFDVDWKLLDLEYRTNSEMVFIPKPVAFESMLEAARLLSSGFSFVRVDLYNVAGRIVFGELTFTPAAGIFSFSPRSWDKKLGEIWTFDRDSEIA